jgi:hypothetical protein
VDLRNKLMFFLPFLGTLLGGLGVSAIGSAMQPKQPTQPGYGQLTAAGAQADAEYLPIKRQLEAASMLGTKARIDTGKKTPTYSGKKMVQVNPQGSSMGGKLVEYDPKDFEKGGQYYGQTPRIVDQQVVSGYDPVYEEVDFTGKGEIQQQADMAKQMAGITLELQKKYGADFVKEALRQEELADPEGVMARKLLIQNINEQAGKEVDQPMADLLQLQIQEDLAAGKNLNADEMAQVEATLARRAGGGDQIQADIGSELTRGLSGDQRLANRQQGMYDFLVSGKTPEDYKYRRSQQNMSNLSAYLAGSTPQDQFAALSGAQRGAAPVAQAQPLSRYTGAGENAALGLGSQNYASQMNSYQQTANPWFAGISTALQGASALGASGWKPFGK